MHVTYVESYCRLRSALIYILHILGMLFLNQEPFGMKYNKQRKENTPGD